MRYLLILAVSAILLAACGVPENPTSQTGQAAATTVAQPTPGTAIEDATASQADLTPVAQPSPTPMAAQETIMPDDPSPTPNPTRQFQAQPIDPAGASPGATPVGALIAPPYDAGMQRYLQFAAGDLAAKLSVDQAAIEIAAVSSVVWPNSGMGCEQAGMAYKQVPVDGFLIELRVNGQQYRYHGGGSRDPFLCTNPSSGAPGSDLSK